MSPDPVVEKPCFLNQFSLGGVLVVLEYVIRSFGKKTPSVAGGGLSVELELLATLKISLWFFQESKYIGGLKYIGGWAGEISLRVDVVQCIGGLSCSIVDP